MPLKLDDFISFVEKYAGEAEALGSALKDIVSHLPLIADDKSNILDKIGVVSAAAASIRDALDKGHFEPAPIVRIDAADIKSAVIDFLKSEEGLALIAANSPALPIETETTTTTEKPADPRTKTAK